MTTTMPALRPTVPHFSSGPCAKRPGWTPQNLNDAPLGRSHRVEDRQGQAQARHRLTREVLAGAGRL